MYLSLPTHLLVKLLWLVREKPAYLNFQKRFQIVPSFTEYAIALSSRHMTRYIVNIVCSFWF